MVLNFCFVPGQSQKTFNSFAAATLIPKNINICSSRPLPMLDGQDYNKSVSMISRVIIANRLEAWSITNFPLKIF